jgi:hypothetical protein
VAQYAQIIRKSFCNVVDFLVADQLVGIMRDRSFLDKKSYMALTSMGMAKHIMDFAPRMVYVGSREGGPANRSGPAMPITCTP